MQGGVFSKKHEAAAHNIDGQFLRVVDVYTNSDEDIIRHMLCHQKYGYARATLLVDIAVEQ
jgi:hypothetical protein